MSNTCARCGADLALYLNCHFDDCDRNSSNNRALREFALQIAASHCDSSAVAAQTGTMPERIVEAAKLYYEFLRGK